MANANETKIVGSIDHIGKEQVISPKFKFVKVIISDMDKNRPQIIEVTFSNGRIDNLAGIKAGDIVEIDAKILGRRVEHENKELVYNTISGYKLNKR